MSCSIAPQRLPSLRTLVVLAAVANNVRIAPLVQIRVLAAYSPVDCRHWRSIVLDEDWSIAAASRIVMRATGTMMRATSASRRVLTFRNAERNLITKKSSCRRLLPPAMTIEAQTLRLG